MAAGMDDATMQAVMGQAVLDSLHAAEEKLDEELGESRSGAARSQREVACQSRGLPCHARRGYVDALDKKVDDDDIEAIRRKRLEQLRKKRELELDWAKKGHGSYRELVDQKAFVSLPQRAVFPSRLLTAMMLAVRRREEEQALCRPLLPPRNDEVRGGG